MGIAVGLGNGSILGGNGALALFDVTALRLYQVTDSRSNPVDAEWLEIVWDPDLPDAGGWRIKAKKSGTGTGRSVAIGNESGGAYINFKNNNNLDIHCDHVGLPHPFAFDRGGYIYYYNGLSLVGHGVPTTRGSGKFTGQSSLQTSVASLTTLSPYNTDLAGTFQVDVWVNIVTAGSSSLNLTIEFVDERGGNQTFTVPMTNAAGTTTVSPLTATGYYYGRALIRAADYSTGSIVVKETGTSPTSHDGGAVITQIQGVAGTGP